MKKYKEFFKSIIVVMATQALVYFLIKQVVTSYHIIPTILNIPLIKQFSVVYGSWYPFILLSAFIIYKHDKDTYYPLIITMLIATVLAHLTFVIYPSMITRPNIEVNSVSSFILDFTYKTDSPVNCLPSVHCLYCFILSYFIFKCKNLKVQYKIPIITYLVLIILSTVFVHQHIIEDVILSLIYTLITIIFVSIFKDKLKNIFKFIF